MSRWLRWFPLAFMRRDVTLVELKREAWAGEPVRYRQTYPALVVKLRLRRFWKKAA